MGCDTMSKKILITSEKDNIGKSLFCVKTAKEIAKKDCKTVILEYSENNKRITEYLDMDEQIIYDIKDAMDGICTIDQSIINIADKVDLIPAPRVKEKLSQSNSNIFKKFLNKLENYYEYILIEADSISKGFTIDLKSIETILILNNNEYSSIKQINEDFIVASDNNIKNKYIIINKYDAKNAKKNNKLSTKDYIKIFPEPLLEFVNYDDKYESLKSDYFLTEYNDELTNTIQELIKKVS